MLSVGIGANIKVGAQFVKFTTEADQPMTAVVEIHDINGSSSEELPA